ncbi:MAG: diaminopimelate decarboxylase [Firmicutes bacterium]|nr:diaminopimelate decarboxylase [Bacillota bacterium]
MNTELMEIKNGTLFYDGCDLTQLAAEFGTPVYVYSQNVIKSRIKELKEAFTDDHPKNRIAYACKAFCCTAMFKLLQYEGLCADVVSGGELYTAIKAGFPAERLEFNGNNKSRGELELAVEYGIGRIIIDSLQELSMLEEICAAKEKKMKVLYRITPGVKADTHDYIITGKKDSKFGIPLDDDIILPYVKAALDSRYVEFLGLHFHIGSQLFENDGYIAATGEALKLAEKIYTEYGFWIKELNLGGGFGVTYTTEERKPFSFFLDPVRETIEAFAMEYGLEMPALVIEPGRSVVAEAGITLYKIGSTKDIPGLRNYAAVDGGMTENIRPALYGAKYTAIVASKADAPADKTVTICGKCCESGDIIIKDIELPELKTGDTLAVLSTGAYGYTMASNYNRNPIPGVLFIDNGIAEWAVKPQTYENMTANDVIPKSFLEVKNG